MCYCEIFRIAILSSIGPAIYRRFTRINDNFLLFVISGRNCVSSSFDFARNNGKTQNCGIKDDKSRAKYSRRKLAPYLFCYSRRFLVFFVTFSSSKKVFFFPNRFVSLRFFFFSFLFLLFRFFSYCFLFVFFTFLGLQVPSFDSLFTSI